jgi:hypothetical protein
MSISLADKGPRIPLEGEHYKLESWYSDTSFTLRRKDSDQIRYFDGDHAIKFRQELDALEQFYPNWDDDALLQELMWRYL